MSAGDQDRGVYRKYKVTRADGSSKKGGKHEACTYFVLDLEHDPFALPALKAYADACAATHPELAKEIRRILATRPCGCRSVGECSHHGLPATPNEAMAKAIVMGGGP